MKVQITWNPQPNFTNTLLNYCLLGLIAQVYTLTIIVIIVINSQAIIDIEKLQYRPSLTWRLGSLCACVWRGTMNDGFFVLVCTMNMYMWPAMEKSTTRDFSWNSRFGYGSTQNLLQSSTVKEPCSKKAPKPSYGLKIVHGSPVSQFTIFRETERFIRT